MVKVDLTVAGHTVIVESDADDLDAVAGKALELWRATEDPRIRQAFGMTALTADTQVAEPEYVSGYDHH